MRFLGIGIWFLVCCGSLLSSAQTLTVDPSYTPQQLIQDVLVGQGVQVSNIAFSGNATARGYFNGSNSNIGLSSGIIISTGRAVDAQGPNGTPLSDPGTEFFGPGDPALSAISGSLLGTFDAAILSFDFVPSSDTVQFRYVFASDEYMLYVGTGVNDVFAFLISGPGIVGEMNVALIPGTTTPVTIDNVNANTNAQYYIDNENPPGNSVEYNGFTQVFTAQAVLQPCQTYRIRLAIADAGDGSYDSAVFLEAGSFTSPSVSLNAESTFSASSSSQELVEGCSSMTLTFERSAPYDDALTVDLVYSGTATVGTDITDPGSSVTFAAGQSTVAISFDVLTDAVTEGVETMQIALVQLNPCASGPPTSVAFTIEDPEPMVVQTSPDVSFVCPEEYTIAATVTGGYPAYSYQWTGGYNTDQISVTALSSSTYNVFVTDACGFTANASTTITMPNYQQLTVNSTDAIVCNGDTATLTATVSGGLGTIQYLWDGTGTDPSYTFSPAATTTITLVVTDSCGLSENTTSTVTVDEVDASFTHELVRNDAVQFENTSVNTNDVLWDFGDGTTGTNERPQHTYELPGTYTVSMTVTNDNGCEATVIDSVTVYPPLHVYVPNSFTPNNDGINDVFGVVGEGYLWYDLEVFDRWGNKVVSGRYRDDTAWDGTYKGKLVPAGAYTYRVWIEPPIGIEVKESGLLMVISGSK
jgi:gliding motility-associated-like protein